LSDRTTCRQNLPDAGKYTRTVAGAWVIAPLQSYLQHLFSVSAFRVPFVSGRAGWPMFHVKLTSTRNSLRWWYKWELGRVYRDTYADSVHWDTPRRR